MARMNRKWIPATFEEACKRAAGRRRYHAERRRARDKRQLLIMRYMVDGNWPGHGIGRVLARKHSVDPATISRDLKYIRKFREHLVKRHGSNFADAVIKRLATAHIHPRQGYWVSRSLIQGLSSLMVKRFHGYPNWYRALRRRN